MKKERMLFYPLFFIFFGISCMSDDVEMNSGDDKEPPMIEIPEKDPLFYYGADLSYVNEMLACGASYKNADNISKDPYTIFSEAGSNLVRVRLWHDPDWTEYSNLADVKKTILRAKEEGMQVLLDFHYSDTWTDPSKQKIPAAWEAYVNDQEKLGSLLYEYTYDTLLELENEDLLPHIVQVGNEINPMILQGEELVWPIDWQRNSFLLNKGIKAVRDISKELDQEIGIMLHIAQPENALWWFKEATANDVTDFDWIGLSYYPNWSSYDLENVGDPMKVLIETYKKRLMIVETAYPFTMDNADGANNILGQEALVEGFSASQQGQLDYLNRLKEIIVEAGGEGLVYWEPAWVSTGCKTLWGRGSHWDNATLFDHQNRATLGMDFFKH
ncbi:glycoside hydrolase family 53 protein [Lutimonas sp.]|uniref:glycoside hydrolase family 53 protein n=1 Tax=Lutimonas sp. TaxID=1872403 RepID=UPI003D9B7922